MDPDLIENPEEFDGFRFYKQSLKSDIPGAHSLVSTTPTYLTFSHGKHACPGRFLAADEIKLLLCNILLHYDFKYPNGQTRPPNKDHGESSIPDSTQKLEFKKLEE
jgi:ent-kaurene oxidase